MYWNNKWYPPSWGPILHIAIYEFDKFQHFDLNDPPISDYVDYIIVN